MHEPQCYVCRETSLQVFTCRNSIREGCASGCLCVYFVATGFGRRFHCIRYPLVRYLYFHQGARFIFIKPVIRLNSWRTLRVNQSFSHQAHTCKLALVTSGATCQGRPVHHRMCSGIPSLSPLDAGTPLQRAEATRNSPDLGRCPLVGGGEDAPSWDPLSWTPAEPCVELPKPAVLTKITSLPLRSSQLHATVIWNPESSKAEQTDLPFLFSSLYVPTLDLPPDTQRAPDLYFLLCTSFWIWESSGWGARILLLSAASPK